jgi:HNH endonuclease
MAKKTSIIPALSAKEQERFWSYVDKRGLDECWLWTKCQGSNGYGHFTAQRKTYSAHRLSWFFANGPIPPGLFICHRCDVPRCCNPYHLFTGSCRDNLRDAVRKGRMASGDRSGPRLYPERVPRGNNHHFRLHPELVPQGERNGSAKLTAAKVRQIRALFTQGMSQVAIAARYHVGNSTIGRIVHGTHWRHVPTLPEVPRG